MSVLYCQECGTALHAVHQEDRERPTCPTCGYIHYLDPKVAVAVIVGDQKGVLLGRRRIDPGSGRWSFPAGYVNRGEVLEEAAVREVWEETGLDVRIDRLFGVYSERGNAVILIVYTAVAGDQEPAAGPEVSEVGWFSPDDLPPLAFPHDRAIIVRWSENVRPAR